MFLGVGKCNGDAFLDCANRFPEIIVTKIVIMISDFVKCLIGNLFITKMFIQPVGVIINKVSSGGVERETEQIYIYGLPFLIIIFLFPDTIVYRKLLEMTKNYYLYTNWIRLYFLFRLS